jgi:hypothetical protein
MEFEDLRDGNDRTRARRHTRGGNTPAFDQSIDEEEMDYTIWNKAHDIGVINIRDLMLTGIFFLAARFASRSLVFSPSSTPTSALSCVCSTRTRSTSRSTSAPSSPVRSAAVSPSTSVPRPPTSSASVPSTSPSGSTPLRYDNPTNPGRGIGG